MEKFTKRDLELILESVEHCWEEDNRLINKIKRNIREMEIKKVK